jgi:hypothetical protein
MKQVCTCKLAANIPPMSQQASCNAVLSGLVGSLLPFFVRKLSEDYKKWAVDPVYRRKRAERKMPLAKLEM